MSLLTLEQLKRIWTYPLSSISCVTQALGNTEQIVEAYLQELVSANNYMKDTCVYSVLSNIPWWKGNSMPCFLDNIHLYNGRNVVLKRWTGKFDLLRQKARPVLYNYLRVKALRMCNNRCVRLLCMAAICSGYHGLHRVVRQFRVHNGPYKLVDVKNPNLTVNISSGIHYEENEYVIQCIQHWMYIYLQLSTFLYFLPQPVILLCAEHIEINNVRQNRYCRYTLEIGDFKVP